VGTDDTCPQGSLSLLDHKVEVAVCIVESAPEVKMYDCINT
jgi:hypothetical protein